jgi:membrane protease YdiL (CAAX protease family)
VDHAPQHDLTAERTPTPEQHSLGRSIVLHLFPGLALTAFVLLASLAIPAVVALLIGIGLVIVPLELGYLLYQARRRNGSWSLEGVVLYRERLPARQLLLWTIPLALWFVVVFVASVALLDQPIADRLFSWYPESLREFATFGDDEEDTDVATWLIALFVALAFLLNGFVGPIVEELYFRGHLLPRIDRYGRGAPVLNSVLFSVYHFWTPWANPGRILGLVPWVYLVWRERAISLGLAVHLTINNVFLLLVVGALLAES